MRRLFVVASDMRKDAGGPQALDLDLIRPIRFSALSSLFSSDCNLADLRLGTGECPGLRGAERAGKGASPRPKGKRSSGKPIAGADREAAACQSRRSRAKAHRDRRYGVGRGQVRGGALAKAGQLVDDLFALRS